MTLAELLQRRRACRDYRDEPVPPELLERVIAAAESAATASNVPYRHLMVVDDPRVIRAIRQISPALMANAPCLLIVMTDIAAAIERVGRVGEASSLIDSGAAGENAWLAAIEAGLASQFTMISAMPGIGTILGLPDTFRVDLIMPLGYPAASGGGGRRPVRRRSPAVHHNQFGHVRD
jgi:nitroreductase